MVALPSSSLISEVVETTQLRTLRLIKDQVCHLEAYVNAYAVDPDPTTIKKRRYHVLYYLSLVGMAGQGTTLEAFFAHLTGSQWKGLYLEGVGEVVLAHHSRAAEACGYRLHWNYEQSRVGESRHLHAIIESRQLTLRDPLQAYRSFPRRRSQLGEAIREARRANAKQQVSKTTAPNGKIKQSASERLNQERHPQFLLLIPGNHQGQQSYREQQHLTFLDSRVPWPLDQNWASFLWERGIRLREIQPLTVWCYTPPVSLGTTSSLRPFLSEAYLCRPNPTRLLFNLSDTLRAGSLSWSGAVSSSPDAEPLELPASLALVPR